SAGGLLVRVEVDDALAEASAVVAGGDGDEAGHIPGGGDGGLGGRDDGGEVGAVDDDFLDAGDSGGEFRLRAELVAERRTELGIGAGDHELVLAAGLRSTGGDAAG